MVEVIAVDDSLFVCFELDVTLDILAAKSPHTHLTLDISAAQTLNCRVPCSHAQRRTESGTDVPLLLQPCYNCATFAIGAATLLAVLPARQLRSIAKAVLTLYDHLDLWHQNCMHSGGGECGE